jgi:hypothetical protein
LRRKRNDPNRKNNRKQHPHAGRIPAMLVDERFDRVYYRDVVEAIFSTSDKGKSDAIIEDYSNYWMSIIGTRGAVGKKTLNSQTKANEHFEIESNYTKEKVVVDDTPIKTTFEDLFE